jgi:AcrR family transcriptional regulator
MTRIVKAPEVRRAELLDTADALFQRHGYANTAVEDIVREAGVAKGTFYHYFRTKEDVLGALATRMVDHMATRLRDIAADAAATPLQKLQRMYAEVQNIGNSRKDMVTTLNRPQNRELHDRNNVEIVRVLGPIVAEVIEQGKATGMFQVDDAVATVQFIMAGSLFLFGEDVFHWTTEEHAARMQAMKAIIQRALCVDMSQLA